MSADSFDERIALHLAEIKLEQEQLHSYQQEARAFLHKNPFSALFIDMGMGKTIISLSVIADLLAEFATDKVLVIGPLRVMTDTWPTEIGLWRHTAWMDHTLLRVDDDDPRLAEARSWARQHARMQGLSPSEIESAARKAETVERDSILAELAHSSKSIHFINREQVEWLINFWQEKWPYRTVFIDESSSFKDHTTLRFKALQKTRQTPGLIERLHILTATPAAETYLHLFAQIYLLDLGKRLGKNITAFRKAFFYENKYKRKWELRHRACEEEILEKIADICLVMKSKDYLPRAEPTIIQQKVKLAPRQLEMMEGLEKTFILDLPGGIEIEAKTAAALSSMLLQMASGSVYETLLIDDFETDDLKKVKRVHHLHDHKIQALKEIYEEAQDQGEPLLVAYHFQSSLARLKKAFPKAVAMDATGKCIKDWNAGKIPMLLVHPQSAGHGLNLQYGGRTLIFFDLIYSLEQYLQTIGRLDRQGQTKPVIVKLLVAEGTRDELVAQCLLEKEDAQERFFMLLKRLIRKLRTANRVPALADTVDDL